LPLAGAVLRFVRALNPHFILAPNRPSALPQGTLEVPTRPLAAALGICIGMMLFGSLLGSLVGGEVNAERYRSLLQPELSAPTAVFLVVSVLYYPIFGTVLYRVLSHWEGTGEHRWILGLTLSTLAFNTSWNALVLDAGRPWVGFLGTAALAALVLPLVLGLARRDRISSLLLVPYLLWVGFDLVWSWRLWQLNPGIR